MAALPRLAEDELDAHIGKTLLPHCLFYVRSSVPQGYYHPCNPYALQTSKDVNDDGRAAHLHQARPGTPQTGKVQR